MTHRHKTTGLLLAKTTALLGFGLASAGSWSQSVPGDLLDASLEALLQAPVRDEARHGSDQTTRWHLSYSYQTSHFEGYYNGTDEVSDATLLWNPKEGPRTDEYIAVTPEVTQEVHALTLGYDWDADNAVRVVMPYVLQRTAHETVIPGWQDFKTATEGTGDVVVSWDRNVSRGINSEWHVSVGVSVPLGSIDKKAPTPRGYGQLPYNMQMGSGTWDIPLGISWVTQSDSIRWGVNGGALYRIGENDNDYHLGHRVDASIWALTTRWHRVEPGLRFAWHWQGHISGADPAMPTPDPMGRYPTPAVDPSKYGGQRLEAGAFARVFLNDDRATYMDLEGGYPIYQNLNGPQVGAKWRLGIRIGTEF